GNCFRCAACKRNDQSGIFRTKPVGCGMGCFFKLLRQSTTAISKPLYKRFCRIVEDLGDFLRTGSENGIELTSTFFQRHRSRVGYLCNTSLDGAEFHRDARADITETGCNRVSTLSEARFGTSEIVGNAGREGLAMA